MIIVVFKLENGEVSRDHWTGTIETDVLQCGALRISKMIEVPGFLPVKKIAEIYADGEWLRVYDASI